MATGETIFSGVEAILYEESAERLHLTLREENAMIYTAFFSQSTQILGEPPGLGPHLSLGESLLS